MDIREIIVKKLTVAVIPTNNSVLEQYCWRDITANGKMVGSVSTEEWLCADKWEYHYNGLSNPGFPTFQAALTALCVEYLEENDGK